MKTLTAEALAAAERYLMLNARLVDRLRFARLFRGGSAAPIRAAVHAYQNPDGGFGNAIEPDLRGASSQPQGIEIAFWILDEIDAFDDAAVPAACDWLESSRTPDGGVPWVLPSVVDDERAPWWQPEGDPAPAALNPTAPIAGLLHAHGIEHRWLADATEFCWRKIAATTEVGDYDALSILAFLERVPDRDRAEKEFARLSEALLAPVALDPDAEGHVHTPLDFAPTPRTLARGLFSDEVIDLHLDALLKAQQDDGGWKPNFLMWTPLVAHEWGGYLTLARLKTLQAYGRIAPGLSSGADHPVAAR
ncbi:hypothetical protein [Promicromonospora panici]|uniref:hypothetical protein n=1 Tax=Promicromonospora panici TaxID=2219658 RepID=UPI00101DFDF9|nr:hypothetical protein [Promicromonospora panici]